MATSEHTELSVPCEGGAHARCGGSVFPQSYPSEVPCSCECHATEEAIVAAAEESGEPPRDWREDT